MYCRKRIFANRICLHSDKKNGIFEVYIDKLSDFHIFFRNQAIAKNGFPDII